MDVMRLVLPVAATANVVGLEEAALVDAVRGALARVMAEVGLPGVEVGYDGDAERFSLVRFIEVAGEGAELPGTLRLEVARELAPEVVPGEELGFDLFELDEAHAARIGLAPDVLHRARRVAAQVARGTLVRAREEAKRQQVRARVGERLEAAPFPAMRRASFAPVVAVGDDLQGSKYGGDPVLLEGEAWPSCPACGLPLELILQLALDGLPEPTGLSGHLQFFWCTNLETDCAGQTSAWFGSEGASALLRVVQGATRAPRDAERPAETPARARLTPRRITGWVREDELPHVSAIRDRLLEERGISSDDYEVLTPAGGDKLLGWPRWIQGGWPPPPCDQCEAPTRLLYQLASDSHAELCWGDLGRVYLLGCEREPRHLRFFVEMS
jgi:hypothetical protein